jgi:hypothetical protein
MLTQSLASLFQFINRLLDLRKGKILRGKRNYSPNTAGSRAEELPSHDVPCAMCPSLLVYIRFCDERRNDLDSPSPLGLKGRRLTPCTGCREAGVGERQFPSGEVQLPYRSGRRMTNFYSRGTAPTNVKITLRYQRMRLLTSLLTPRSIASIRSRGFLVTCCRTSAIISGMSTFLNICPPTMVQTSAGTMVFCWMLTHMPNALGYRSR